MGETKLDASNRASFDQFGKSVALSGDSIVVGAHWDDSSRGSAYVFDWNGSVWSQTAKLVASDGAAADLFGNSVAISGQTVVVGALQS